MPFLVTPLALVQPSPKSTLILKGKLKVPPLKPPSKTVIVDFAIKFILSY